MIPSSRERALTASELALAAVAAAEGAPGVLRFSGEAGIGKSWLLTEVAARADKLGFLVLGGRAAEFDPGVPFGPVVDALDGHLAGWGEHALGLGDVAADVAAVFPSVATRTEPTVVLSAERYRLHRAVRHVLGVVAQRTPLLFTIDDLHWADEATVELVLHLLDAPAPRVLVAITDRPAQVDARIAAAAARAQAAGRAVVLDVGPLSRPEVDHVVGPGVPTATLDRIFVESGGNPFFLTELARAEAADASRPDHLVPEVPPAVQAVIASQIATLSDETRAFAAGGAVAGDPFDPDAAAVAAAVAPARRMDLVDELLAAGLLVATDQPRLFGFRHPIVRRAVYEQAGAGWRLGAHQRLADHLAAEGASPLVLAQHVAAVAKPGDATAIHVLAAAARLVEPSSPAAAAGWYDRAIRLVPETEAAVRVGLLSRKADVLAAGGRIDQSHDAFVEALALVPAKDAKLLVEVTVRCAALDHLRGSMDDAHARLRKALTALPDRRTSLGARLLAELAVNAGWFRGDWAAAEEHASEAVDVARRVGAAPVEVLALAVRAFADYSTGRTEQASATLAEAADRLDHLDDDDLVGHLDVIYYLGRTEYFTDRTVPALRHADRGIRLCHRSGNSPFLQLLLGVHAGALSNQGRLEEAAADAQQCVDGARLSSDRQTLLIALMDLLWIETNRGRIDTALAVGDEALDLAMALPDSMTNTSLGWGVAAACLEAGDTERAAQLLLGPEVHASLEAAPLPGPILAWHLIARTMTRLGRLDDAQQWLDRIDDALPKVNDMAAPQVWRATVAAELLLARGDPAGAATAALAAIDVADRAGLLYDASRMRLLAGRALGAAGDRERAIALLDQSRSELTHYGADRYAEQAVQQLRRLGQRIGRGGRRGQGSSGLDTLSEHEREIAELAAAGRTNKEIADTLFVSGRTVERHLSHVFDKLAIQSRAQLGSLLADADR